MFRPPSEVETARRRGAGRALLHKAGKPARLVLSPVAVKAYTLPLSALWFLWYSRVSLLPDYGLGLQEPRSKSTQKHSEVSTPLRSMAVMVWA